MDAADTLGRARVLFLGLLVQVELSGEARPRPVSLIAYGRGTTVYEAGSRA